MLTADEVSLFFKKSLAQLKTQPIKSFKKLEVLADEVATGRTIHKALVFNQVYQTARLPQQTFHTTPWRDKQIKQSHLKIVTKALKVLKKKKTPLYEMRIRSGSGSQQKIWELLFTKKGVPLAIAAAIMMEPLSQDRRKSLRFGGDEFLKKFSSDAKAKQIPMGSARGNLHRNPARQKELVNGCHLAIPELAQLVPSQKEPLILFNVNTAGFASIFVGGSDYPGEIYKSICKAHNGWVYDLDGFEVHGAGYVANYINSKGKAEKTLVVISGLSLHGKSALSSTDGVQPAFLAGESSLKEVQFLGIHDDYLAFLPLDIQRKSWEVFAYAPHGLFPAVHGEKSDAPLIADPRVALYSVWVDKQGRPDFTKKMNNSVNQRAASPIDTVAVFRRGKRVVRDFEKVVMIILTRNNFCPSAVIFKNPIDFAYSFAGVVVQKTDAVTGDFPEVYYNFACTDFDVVERHQYLRRLVENFNNFGPSLVLALMNTGAPGPEESMRVRDAIASGYAKTKFDKNLGVEIVSQVPGFEKLYFPWKQGGYSYKQTVNQWKRQQKERREFMKERSNCRPDELLRLIGKPKALV